MILPESLSAKPTLEWEPTDIDSFLKENQSHFRLSDETVSALDMLTGEDLVEINEQTISLFNLNPVQSLRVLKLLKHLGKFDSVLSTFTLFPPVSEQNNWEQVSCFYCAHLLTLPLFKLMYPIGQTMMPFSIGLKDINDLMELINQRFVISLSTF